MRKISVNCCYPKERPNVRVQGTCDSEALYFFLVKLFDVLGEKQNFLDSFILILWLVIVYLSTDSVWKTALYSSQC